MQPATLDLIQAQARTIKPLRTLLTIVAAVFYALGWVAAWTLGLIWVGITWAVAALVVGWKSARKGDG